MSKTNDTDKCNICGGAKEGAPLSSASITQWIQRCRCNDLPPDDEPSTLNICSVCGKRVEEGRTGSFTQWIFRTEVCKCAPENRLVSSVKQTSHNRNGDGALRPVSTAVSSNRRSNTHNRLLSVAPKPDEIIDLDGDKFPIDRYAPTAVLGGGSAGTVYLAFDKVLNKRVTIKTLNSLSEKQVIAFQKEAKATSSLEHDNIIKVLDFGITRSGTPYMVMEYFAGESVDKLLQRETALDVLSAIEVFIPVCEALGHAHKKGIYHRDVTCSNILVSTEGDPSQVKLIDFGVAGFKPDESSTVVQGVTLVGTPQYMSPDQAQSRAYNERSEIYSVGCVMFETLTGRPPFSAESALELINKHASETPPTLSEAALASKLPTIGGDGFPEQLEIAIRKCLEKDPDSRFQTMEQLRDALLRIKSLSDNALESETLFAEQESDKASFSEVSKTSPETKPRSMMPLYVMLTVLIIGGVSWLIFGKLFETKPAMPLVGKTMRMERRPFVSGASQQIRAKVVFRPSILTGRVWLSPQDQITDEDLKALAGRKDFAVLGLDRQGLSGTGLRYVKDSGLQGISLHGTTLSPEGYETLAQIKTLRELILDKSDVTDAELGKLVGLPDLKFIALDDTPVSNTGMTILSSIHSLTTVSISGAREVSGAGLRSLVKLPILTSLIIDDTSIDTKSLDALKEAKHLKIVSVRRLNIKNDDLHYFTTLNNLETLDLGRNPINDAAIDALASMKHLRRLQIGECRITPTGVAELKKRMPNTMVLTSLRPQDIPPN